MDLPVLRETQALAALPTISITIGTMVALNKCGVHHRADRRGCERRADRFLLPEHNSHFHMHHAPLVPGLVYRCVLQAGWGHEIGLLGPTRLTGVWRDDRLSIHVQNRRLVGGVLIGD